MKDGIIEVLHQPEYTGENRCIACTIVNSIIAVTISGIVARRSKLAAVVAAGISAVLIYLRGYLIPGTPTLTKQYLPAEVLQLFGKETDQTVYNGFGSVEPRRGGTDGGEQTLESTQDNAQSTNSIAAGDERQTEGQSSEESVDPISPEEFFLKHDIVDICEDSDDLCLTESFEVEWDNEIDEVDSDMLDGEDAAVAVGLTEDEADFDIIQRGEAYILLRNNQQLGQWPSKAALVADVTAARVFDSWADGWESLSVEQKGALLNSLRLFLETCPTTGGEVTISEETVESCCQSHDVVAVTCEESGERLFEHRISELDG